MPNPTPHTSTEAGGPAFRIRHNNRIVAKENGEDAENRIWEMAFELRRTGEVTIQDNAAGFWKRHALLAHWPEPRP